MVELYYQVPSDYVTIIYYLYRKEEANEAMLINSLVNYTL